MAGPKWEDTEPIENAPKWDDTEEITPQDDSIGELQSVRLGAEQGATLGFSDELTGAGKSVYDVATTDKSMSDLADLYREYRDTERMKLAQAEAENPYAYMGGNIAGGIATSFIPGLGPLSALKSGAGAGQIIRQGAQLGALSGLGTTKAELTEPDSENLAEAIEDTATGGALGATIATGLGVVAPAALNVFKNTPLAKIFTRAKNVGKQGIDITTEEARKRISEETLALAKKYGMSLDKAQSIINKRISSALEQAEISGVKVDLTDFLNEAEKEIQGLVDFLPQDTNIKKGMLETINKQRQGTPMDIEVPVNKEVSLPATKGTREILEDEAILEVNKLKALGINADYTINESTAPDGRKILTKIIREQGAPGKGEVLKTKFEPDFDPQTGEVLRSPKVTRDIDPDTGEEILGTEIFNPSKGPISVQQTQKVERTPENIMNDLVRAKSIFELETSLPARTEVIPSIEKQTVMVGANPIMEARKANEFRKAIARMAYDKDYKNPAFQAKAKELSGKATAVVKDKITALKTLNPQHQKITEALDFLGLDSSDFDNLNETDLGKKISSLVANMSEDDLKGIISSEKLEKSVSALRDAGFGNVAEKLGESLKKQAEVYDLATIAGGAGIGDIRKLGFTLQGAAAFSGNKLGQSIAQNPIKAEIASKAGSVLGGILNKVPSKLTPIGQSALFNEDIQNTTSVYKAPTENRNIYNEPNESLTQLASQIEQLDANIGSTLREAIASGDEQKKNATLFTIMQKPNLRRLYQGE